jgi:beta-galactosidase
MITKSGVNEDDKTIRYYYNYSSNPLDFVYPHKNGRELISEDKVESGSTLKISPWDVLIIEE